MHQKYKGNLWGFCLWKGSESEKRKHFHHHKGNEKVAACSWATIAQAFPFLTGAQAPLEKHQDIIPHPGILIKYLQEFLVVCTKRSDNALPYSIEFLFESFCTERCFKMTKAPNRQSNTSMKDTQQGGNEDKGYSYMIPQWLTLSMNKTGWCN